MIVDAAPITVAYGDGIGSEIMEATLTILREAGANITIETIEIGERIYNMGAKYGILPSAWETLRRNRVLLKSPITLPQNSEQKDINEAIYEKFGLSNETLIISNLIDLPDTDWLSASSNIAEDFALFETIHDSAPDIAGKDIANPSAIIQASIMMLEHIGQQDVASLIKDAWLRTLDDGIHTADIYRRNRSNIKVGTKEFTESIIERLGQKRHKNI
jgi:isocitrate/isopropylmalate dehydrogenase